MRRQMKTERGEDKNRTPLQIAGSLFRKKKDPRFTTNRFDFAK